MKKTIGALIAIVALIVGYLIVTKPSVPASDTNQGSNAGKNVLYVYNWTEYVPTSLLQKFTRETGIEVRYSTYESNEEMFSKLKLLKGEGYDLIFPSSYFVPLLQKEGLIQPLDKTKVDVNKILPDLLGRGFDPDNEFTIPYVYGFTTIGINKSIYDPSKITKWRDLWNPEYKNLVLLNDVLDNFSMALLSRGVDPNKATPEQIDTAYNDLAQLIKKVSQFNSDSPEVPYVEGTSGLGMVWSGSAFRANLESEGNIDVIYPEEGVILWMDNFAIPSKAKNVDAAYKFINFLLERENSYEIIKEMGFQTSSSEVRAVLPEDWQNSHILYPPHEVYEKAVMNEIPPEELEMYINLWNKLKVD